MTKCDRRDEWGPMPHQTLRLVRVVKDGAAIIGVTPECLACVLERMESWQVPRAFLAEAKDGGAPLMGGLDDAEREKVLAAHPLPPSDAGGLHYDRRKHANIYFVGGSAEDDAAGEEEWPSGYPGLIAWQADERMHAARRADARIDVSTGSDDGIDRSRMAWGEMTACALVRAMEPGDVSGDHKGRDWREGADGYIGHTARGALPFFNRYDEHGWPRELRVRHAMEEMGAAHGTYLARQILGDDDMDLYGLSLKPEDGFPAGVEDDDDG